MLRTGLIYCYTNTFNNKKYVGKTVNEQGRKKVHKSDAKRGSNCPFHRAIRKYGFDSFNYEVLERITSDESELNKLLNEREIYYIDKLECRTNGYNATNGGDGMLGNKRTEESLKRGIETKRKNGNLTRTESTKSRISEANRGKHNGLECDEVNQYDLNDNYIATYKSAAEVERVFGYARQNIRKCCLGKNKTAYSFKWKFKQII